MRGRPLLDLTSYARRAHVRPLTAPEIEHIRRTVSRTPEVMVKVLTRGGQNLSAVQRHLSYLDRGGELELETDDGTPRSGREATAEMLEDWDLDLDEVRRRDGLSSANGRQPPKLVHKLILSMPAGTPPTKVLAAARDFAREEFALKHRYAMVLHTDEPHPHVHIVLKAVSEQGERLHIRKATLRVWRQDFARHLRQHGIQANATERAVRGEVQTPKLDGIYRAQRRGESRQSRHRVEAVATCLHERRFAQEPGKAKVVKTRAEVVGGFQAVAEELSRREMHDLSRRVEEYVVSMPRARTENEQIADRLSQQAKAKSPPGQDRVR